MTVQRIPYRRAVLAAAAIVLGLTFLAPPAQAQTEPLTVRFSWKLKGEYAPFYVALDKGYFRDQGIAVTLGEGAGAQATLAAVDTGRETATYAPAIHSIQAISKGLNVKIVALYQPATPMVVISHPDNPIRTAKDLEGKRLGVSVGDTFGDFLPVFCSVNKIDCAAITRVNLNISALIPAFAAKQIDATSAYLTNDVPNLQAQGMKFEMLDVRDFGLKVPGGSLMVSAKTAAEKPDSVRKLLKALAAGYAFARENPLEAARIIKKYWTTSISDEIVAEQVRQTAAAAPLHAGKPLGWIDEAALVTAMEQMKAAGQLPAARPLADYFTNSLLGQ